VCVCVCVYVCICKYINTCTTHTHAHVSLSLSLSFSVNTHMHPYTQTSNLVLQRLPHQIFQSMRRGHGLWRQMFAYLIKDLHTRTLRRPCPAVCMVVCVHTIYMYTCLARLWQHGKGYGCVYGGVCFMCVHTSVMYVCMFVFMYSCVYAYLYVCMYIVKISAQTHHPAQTSVRLYAHIHTNTRTHT
jgi:hypothetical protein